MLIVYIILAVMDFISTFSVGEIAQYLEANPLYILGLGFPFLIAYNIFAIWVILKLYEDYFKVHRQYMILSTFIWFCLLRILVIVNNFSVVKEIDAGTITVETAMAVTTTAKLNYYVLTFTLLLLAPVFISWLIYWIFIWEHKVVQKNE